MTHRTVRASANDNAEIAPLAVQLTLDSAQLERLAAALAPLLARELALVLPARDNFLGADVSPRRGRKEDGKWRSEERASASLDPIHMQDDGDSSWLAREAKNLVKNMRARRKQTG